MEPDNSIYDSNKKVIIEPLKIGKRRDNRIKINRDKAGKVDQGLQNFLRKGTKQLVNYEVLEQEST